MLQPANSRTILIRKAKAVAVATALVLAGASTVQALDPTGALDTAYGDDGVFAAPAPSGSTADMVWIAAGPNGTTLHLIQYWSAGQPGAYAITQVDENGEAVSTYGTNGVRTIPADPNAPGRRVHKLLHNGSGAVTVLGSSSDGSGDYTYLARFDGSGAPVSGFGTNGEVRHLTYVNSSEARDFTVSNGGYIYVWGQSGPRGRMARFAYSTGANTEWGTGGASTKSFIAAPTGSNLEIIGFRIEQAGESSSQAIVTVWGTSRVDGSDKAVIGRWTMTAGQSEAVTASWGTNNSGYVELSSGALNPEAVSYAVSGQSNVYMLIKSATTTNRSVVAFKLADGAPTTGFNRGAGTDGVATVNNTSELYQITTASFNAADRVYILGTASNGGQIRPFVEAFDSTGALVQTFGINGRAAHTTCSPGLNAQAFAVTRDANNSARDAAVVVGGSNTDGYYAVRMKDGTFTSTPTCGPTTVPQGGGGGGGSLLPDLSPTLEEVAGPGIKVTVASLVAGARLRLVVYPDSFVFGPNMTEVPDMVTGATGETSMTLTSAKWLPLGQGSPRTEPIQAGVTYVVGVSQFSGSSYSREVNASITITGNVASDSSGGDGTTETASPTAAPATTVPSSSATATAIVPGVTVTDTKIYTAAAPRKVAANSAIAVLTPAQARTSDIVTKTPSVCLPANDDLVFIDTGRCVAQVVNEKSGAVLRTLRTRVVKDEVSELNVGNEVVTLAPIFFTNGSSDLTPAAKRRLRGIRSRVTAAGTVLLVGHTGVMLGDTAENRALADARARSVAAGLRAVKAKGPFYVTPVGGGDPVVQSMRREDQAKNRRVEIILVP